MQRGRIVEEGTHTALFDRGGLYTALARAEFGRASSIARIDV
jgi:ABC-type multidrug transport system fused ATPase/permease subunit